MAKKLSVCVFCGAHNSKQNIYEPMAEELGSLIAKNNMRLVYGAGGTGLMGKIATGALKEKGEVYGITTKQIAAFEKPVKGTKFKISKNIQERKKEFIESSDAFISLPGGFGTFDEIFEVLVHTQINDKHNVLVKKKTSTKNKPTILINLNGFFDPFIKLVDSMIKSGLVNATNKKYYKIVKTPKEAINYIKKELNK